MYFFQFFWTPFLIQRKRGDVSYAKMHLRMGKEFSGDFSWKLRRMVLIHKRRKIITVNIKISTIIMVIHPKRWRLSALSNFWKRLREWPSKIEWKSQSSWSPSSSPSLLSWSTKESSSSPYLPPGSDCLYVSPICAQSPCLAFYIHTLVSNIKIIIIIIIIINIIFKCGPLSLALIKLLWW